MPYNFLDYVPPIHFILSGESAEDGVSYLFGDPARLFRIQDQNYKFKYSPLPQIYTVAYNIFVLGVN